MLAHLPIGAHCFGWEPAVPQCAFPARRVRHAGILIKTLTNAHLEPQTVIFCKTSPCLTDLEQYWILWVDLVILYYLLIIIIVVVFCQDQCCIRILPVHIGQGQHSWDTEKFPKLAHMVTQCQRRECHWPHSEINRINLTYNVHLWSTSAWSWSSLISYQILNELIHQLLVFGDLFLWVVLLKGCITSTAYAGILPLSPGSLLMDPVKQRTGPPVQQTTCNRHILGLILRMF